VGGSDAAGEPAGVSGDATPRELGTEERRRGGIELAAHQVRCRLHDGDLQAVGAQARRRLEAEQAAAQDDGAPGPGGLQRGDVGAGAEAVNVREV